MPAISPLASLYQVLQTARTNAQTHSELLRKSEAATRAALIDPILRALGWDTANVQVVEPEKTINTTWRADYALHHLNGKIDLLLEAKCLGSNLERFSVVQQLLSYAFGFGVLKLVVTDGINWHYYTEFKPGNSTANSQFNLLDDDLVGCGLQLLQWLDAAQSGHGIPLTLPAVATPTGTGSASTLAKPAPPVAKPQSLPKKLKVATNFIEVSRLKEMNLPDGQKPKLVRLPNSAVKPIKVWKDILLEVCHLLLTTNSNLALPLADKAGKSRFLLSSQKPEKGSSSPASYKGKTVFIGTHYSAADCIDNALYAAQLLPANQQTATLAIGF